MDDEKIRVEILYGSILIHPEQCAIITMGPPLKWYEAIYYGALEIFYEVIVPAFLMGLSLTCFMYSAKVMFS